MKQIDFYYLENMELLKILQVMIKFIISIKQLEARQVDRKKIMSNILIIITYICFVLHLT